MVHYARSDIVRLQLGSIGCGRAHERPVKDPATGALVPVWGIDCPPCEAHLDSHQWTPRRSRIPTTPDEDEEIKELEERARVDEERQRRLVQQEMARTRSEQLRADVSPVPDEDVAITKSEPDRKSPEPAQDRVSAADFTALDKGTLKDLARGRNLSVGGTKDDLIARIVAHDNEGVPA